MLNAIYIKNNAINRVVVSGGVSPNVSIYFENETYSADKTLDIFLGTVYDGTKPMLPTDAGLKVSLSGRYLVGDTIHFRINDDGAHGRFFHISIDPEKEFSFTKYNQVCVGNRFGATIEADYKAGRNTYGSLGKFTYGELNGFTQNLLRNGEL